MKKTRSTSSGSRVAVSKNKKSASPISRTPSSANRSNASNRNGSSTNGRSSSATSAPRNATRTTSNGRATSNGRSAVGNRSRSKQTTPREDLYEVLKDGLKDIYYAEKQLVKALKKMNKAATNEELRNAFETHRTQTEGHVGMLEQAFEAMEIRAAGKKCPAMDGLIEEASEHIEKMDKGHALDAALIVGAQKVEHYEIAAYGSLRAFARCLGIEECEQIFDEILQQESETDELLTQIAETVNREALSGEKIEVGEMEEQQM